MNIPELPQNDCTVTCELYTYCATARETARRLPLTSTVEFEAERIIRQTEEEMRAAQTEGYLQEWKKALHARYADYPELLAHALSVADRLHTDIEVHRFGADITAQELGDFIADREHKDQILADAAEYRETHDCPGLQRVKVGRFLSRRTVTVCGLAETHEFQEAQVVKDEKTAQLRQLRYVE